MYKPNVKNRLFIDRRAYFNSRENVPVEILFLLIMLVFCKECFGIYKDKGFLLKL